MTKPFIAVRNSFISESLDQAIEAAVNRGWYGAHKHTDNPTEEQIKMKICDEIEHMMNEVFQINYLDNDHYEDDEEVTVEEAKAFRAMAKKLAKQIRGELDSIHDDPLPF